MMEKLNQCSKIGVSCYACFRHGNKQLLYTKESDWISDKEYPEFEKIECRKCGTILYKRNEGKNEKTKS